MIRPGDRVQVVVMRRAKRLPRGQRRIVCEQPVFRKGASATENSIIATGRSMIVENNYGYFPPPDATSNGKYDRARGRAGRYRAPRPGLPHRLAQPRDLPEHRSEAVARERAHLPLHEAAGTPDAWFVTAIDFHTGRTRWRRLIGTGLFYNVHYSGLTISPRGVLYTGVLGGTVAVADG
jgi:hypothetical protein